MALLIKFFVIIAYVIRFGSTRSTFVKYSVTSNSFYPFPHFWKSTGFCPPDPKIAIPQYLNSKDVKINLALIAALPNNAIKYVRVHWILNLLIKKADNEEYDFKYMDEFFDYLRNHNLKPHFEFMGWPTAKSNNPNQLKTYNFWYNLIKKIISRYLERYGVKEVSSWRYETWNEPDLKNYNLLNFTLPEYLQYVKGSAKGLADAFASKDNITTPARLGGPAGLFRDKRHPLCWGIVETCNNLGQAVCPLKFISFHRKGDGRSEGVVNGTVELLHTFRKKFPNLRNISIANDESDILTRWSKGLKWRADARYAAMVVKVISEFYKSVALERNFNIESLSNDNGFLNYHPYYFTQRTLLARFQMNNTNPPHVQFIKKPVYSVMSFLSLLGDEYLEVDVSENKLVSVIATRSTKDNYLSSTLLLSYLNDTVADVESVETVNIEVNNIAGDCPKYVLFVLDNIRTNPYYVWKKLNKPVFPTWSQRRKMRKVEEPYRMQIPSLVNGSVLQLSLNFTLPSIAVLHICEKSKRPGPIKNLQIFNVTWNEVLLTWDDSEVKSRCVRTYEVLFRSFCENWQGFKRLNAGDTIFLSYQHATKGDPSCERTRGNYKVRVLDYWEQEAYSKIVSYP